MTDLVFRHAWLFMLVAMTANCLVWWIRGGRTRNKFPERAASYKRIIGWTMVAGNVPWFALAGGVIFGKAPTTLHVLTEIGSNIWSNAFWFICIGLAISFAVYVFRFGGADELALHPGLLNLPDDAQTKGLWQLMAIMMIVSQIFAAVVVWQVVPPLDF